jgi:hypothetical protein
MKSNLVWSSRAEEADQMRSWTVARDAKSRGAAFSAATADCAAVPIRLGQSPAARFNIGKRCLVGVSATTGAAAEIAVQRPLQHPCCCVTNGIDVQQMDTITIASAIEAPIAVTWVHLRLFTSNNVVSSAVEGCDASYVGQ